MEDNLFTFNSKNPMKNNQYLKFLKKIVIILAIFTISDQVVGHIIHHLFFNIAAGENYRTTFTIDSTKADILVFGASRANHHYVPDILENELKMEVYNTGRDGNGLLYNYATFKAVTKRYLPKKIIFDIIPQELIYSKVDYERLSSLSPYYNDHPEIRDIIELKGPFEKYKMLSEIYPYNSQLIAIVYRNISRTKDTFYKGYSPLHKKMDTMVADNAKEESFGTIDNNKIKALNDIAGFCNKNKISLIFVCSPVFSNPKEKLRSKIIEDIALSENSRYFDFSCDSTFDNHPEYFQDNLHLNENGAKIFSKIICGIVDVKNTANPITMSGSSSSITVKSVR